MPAPAKTTIMDRGANSIYKLICKAGMCPDDHLPQLKASRVSISSAAAGLCTLAPNTPAGWEQAMGHCIHPALVSTYKAITQAGIADVKSKQVRREQRSLQSQLLPAVEVQRPDVRSKAQPQIAAAILQSYQQETSLHSLKGVALEEVLGDLPKSLCMHPGVETYRVDPTDPRTGLHGQQGARAATALESGTVLGVHAGFQILEEDQCSFTSPLNALSQLIDLVDRVARGRSGCSNQEVHQEAMQTVQLLGALSYPQVRLLHAIVSVFLPAPGKSVKRRASREGGSSPEGGQTLRERCTLALMWLRGLLLKDMIDKAKTWGLELSEEEYGLLLDPSVITSWLRCDQVSWEHRCHAMGADTVMCTASAFLLPEEGEIKQEGRSKGAGFNLTQERVLDLHNHRPLVMYAVGAHMSDLAYANDPATDISSRRAYERCDAGGSRLAEGNVDLVSVKVAGWPFLFWITTERISKGQEISYTYGWEYWEGHARLKERAEDAAQHAAVVLSNARLQAANAALEAQVSSQEHQLAEVAGDRQKITHLQSELHAAVDIANIALEEASRQTEHTDKVVQKYKAEAEEARVELAKAKKQVQQLRAVKKKLKTQLSKARQTAVALVNSLKEVVDPSSEDMVSD